MTKMLEIGQVNIDEVIVTQEMSADTYGNTGVDVLATPWVIGLLEGAAHHMIEATLSEGQGSVGTMVNVRHLAATPVGMKVSFKAELVEITGKRYLFNVEARDATEVLASGTHERYVLDSIEKFLGRVMAKKP